MTGLRPSTPLHEFLRTLGGGPRPGQLGLVVAPAGVGKSALLAHLAIDEALAERSVVHVSFNESVDRVRAHYDDVLRAALKLRGADRERAGLAVERRRMVLAYPGETLDVGEVEGHLQVLATAAQFEPTLIVVDGLEFDVLTAHVGALRALAEARQVALWVGVRAPGALPEELRRSISFALRLEPEDQRLRIHAIRHGRVERLPWRLDPQSHALFDDESDQPPESDAVLVSTECTLYSGGARGTEAAFGDIAARWGLREVNFTFDGHKQERTEGAYRLSPRELEAGDVSLVYVSRRLNRTYNENGLIRRVLQALWHMVSRSQQVFVVGAIQADGTVVGGTGWSVELGRMWSKDLWVFDQDQDGWFNWDGTNWIPGVPRIQSAYVAGTGTRYLDANGREAIEALFHRSFGAPPGELPDNL